MATSDFRYLDSLPIDHDLLKLPSSSEDSTTCKSYLNLSFNSFNAFDRLSFLHKDILIKQKQITIEEIGSFSNINLLLESNLITLLQIPTISNLDKSFLTEHYCRRKITVNNNKILPSEAYTKQLLFSGLKTWGAFYGSLGYFTHLLEEFEEYKTPSQLITDNTSALIQLMLDSSSSINTEDKNINNFKLILSNLNNYIIDSSEVSDLLIYKTQISLIIDVEIINDAFKQLRFYQTWLPLVLLWYLGSYKTTNEIKVPLKPKDSNAANAYELLLKVAQLCLSYGFDEYSFNNLDYKLLHQTIPPLFYSFIEELNQLRKAIIYSPLISSDNKSYEEELVDLLLVSIPINSISNIVRSASQFILKEVCPPGGYTLLNVMLAANLLNRAYILTHENNLDIDTINKSFINLNNTELDLLGRVAKLIFLSGLCLIKTSLPEITNLGRNFIYLSNVDVSDLQPFDLIDGF